MKLPKTRYEPTIENGVPHGVPYTMDINVIFPTPYSQAVLDAYININLDIGNVAAAKLHHSTTLPYSAVTIPRVPISSVRALSFDVAPAVTITGPSETQDWADGRYQAVGEYWISNL